MPSLYADPGRRAGGGAEFCDGDRRSVALQEVGDVAAYFGLTSRRWQSGSSIDVQGRISKAGDGHVRRALYEAASALLTRFKRKDKVKSWGAGDCQARLAPQGHGGGGAQARRDHACDVG